MGHFGHLLYIIKIKILTFSYFIFRVFTNKENVLNRYEITPKFLFSSEIMVRNFFLNVELYMTTFFR
jgi:hypothetical protein